MHDGPAALNAPVLEVRDLKTYFDLDGGTVRAVDGVSVDLSRGCTLAVVGESGCGKSAMARSILRLTDANGRLVAGRITLHGAAGPRDLAQMAPHGAEIRRIRGREIALIFQEPMTSFSPVHTIGNQIIETIRLHTRMSQSEARQHGIEQLALVSTPHPEHILTQYAWELSGGLRQRAMIAMALSCNPSVVIADEPTTALDVTTQAQVLELLRRQQSERSMALMLITHDLGVVAAIADDVVVMYLGIVVEQGPVDAIFHDTRHPYTSALVRSMPDPASKPRTRLATLRGSVPHPLHRPAGCPFHTRCPRQIPGLCDRQMPPALQVGPAHTVRCHLYDPASHAVAEH